MDASIEETLSKANELEKKYEWLEASKHHEQALKTCEEDYFKRGRMQENIGYSLHRAAFQNEEREEFIDGLKKAVEAYGLAKELFEQMQDDQGAPWILRCEAFSKYLQHWTVSDASEKLRLLTECHRLKRKALESFWSINQKREYCRTYSELEHVTELLFFREWNPQLRRDAIEYELSSGEKTIKMLPEIDDSYEAAKVNAVYFGYLELYWNFIEPPWKMDIIRHHVDEALKHAEEIGDSLTIGRCYIFLGVRTMSIITEKSHNYLQKALEFTEKTRDIFLKGVLLCWIAYGNYWTAFSNEDPDQRIKWADKAMEFYDQSQNLLKILSFQYPNAGKITGPDPGGYAEYYLDRASWETDINCKKEFLKKSEELGIIALKNAESLGLTTSIGFVSRILSRTLASQARLETDLEKKRVLLVRAEKLVEKNHDRDYPKNIASWNPGVSHINLGQIKMELALIEQDQENKIKILKDARSSYSTGLEWCYKKLREGLLSLGNLAILSEYQDSYGTTLTYLYELTNDEEHLRKAIEVWHYAIELTHKVPLFGRPAELYWKIAKAYTNLGEHLEAAENFEHASESYWKAAENITQLEDFYQEYASYMRAWAEFERAKQNHKEKRYLQAKEHYEKAAELHKSIDRWSYLAPNYLAWARLEEAEDLSRREETEEARDLFQQASGLFKEAKGSIETKLRTIQDEEERKLLTSLVHASDIRRDYCLGRIALEDGRILDRQGDHLASAREYGQATERFQKVIDTMESESDRKELRPVIYLCQAWEKMMLAEARTSSEFYNEAAELFEQARKHALDQSTSLLAQAHSSFCKALEAGTRYERDRDSILFSTAKNHIEAATSQYLRAGYKTMSDYVGATSRLLDAYQYSYNAQTEVDANKKAQFYQMAERLLQSSAGAYLKAKHPEKSDEVRRILERVKEERGIAVSLTEILHAPTLVSTTTSFSSPSPTHEQAVGLDRFENADIQANLIMGAREIKVGDDLDLEIELVNAGKAPAQLIKVTEIIPKGFEVVKAPETCRVKDSYIDMKGRTLLPLRTQELKLVLHPVSKGVFEFKPRVLYLDEAGKYRSHKPEPVSITVQELGIRGWIRGSTR